MSKATKKLEAKAKPLEITRDSYISVQEMSFHSVEKLNEIFGGKQ